MQDYKNAIMMRRPEKSSFDYRFSITIYAFTTATGRKKMGWRKAQTIGSRGRYCRLSAEGDLKGKKSIFDGVFLFPDLGAGSLEVLQYV